MSMLFASPSETPYDLRFSLFGIPVRVHPMFWLVSAILGAQAGDLPRVVLWVACVFVSVVIHEMGHGLTAKAFGSRPWIALYGMGGLCYSTERTLGQRLLVIVMGPGAGFITAGLIYAFLIPRSPQLSEAASLAVWYLFIINLVWSIFNLLPVIPLDGGRLTLVVLQMFRLRKATRIAYVISLIVAILAAVYFLQARSVFNGLLFAMFAFESFQVLQNMPAWAEDERF